MSGIVFHICCVPCGVWPVHLLHEEGEWVVPFYYNPNIHPREEEVKRLREARALAAVSPWDRLVAPPSRSTDWDEAVRGLEDEPERGLRCAECFRMRLRQAFAWAREHGLDRVGTALTLSPWKRFEQIVEVGHSLERDFPGITFLDRNFRKQDGVQKGRKMARDLGLYQQDYCGCRYSLREREERLRSRGQA